MFLTEGSLLFPVRAIDLSPLHQNDPEVVNKHGVVMLDMNDCIVRLEAGRNPFLLLKASVSNGVMELESLIEGKVRRVFLEEKDFHNYFCVYPTYLLEKGLNLTPEEVWLTRYFKVQGRLFFSRWNARPRVVFRDYDLDKENRFLEPSKYDSNRQVAVCTDKKTEPLGETESLVVGHAVRIRPGNQKLVFQFYHPRTARMGWWEFNERHTPKKLAKHFSDNWQPFYRSSLDYPKTLYMKRVF